MTPSRERGKDCCVSGWCMLQTCPVLTNVFRRLQASQGKRVFRAVCRYLECGMIWYEITLVSKGKTDIYTCSRGSLPREYVSARVAVAQRCVWLTWTCQSGSLILVHVNNDHERSDDGSQHVGCASCRVTVEGTRTRICWRTEV
jgi:hypothetical protein